MRIKLDADAVKQMKESVWQILSVEIDSDKASELIRNLNAVYGDYATERCGEGMENLHKVLQVCENCRVITLREDMLWTKDCHGVIFRHVCEPCYRKLMEKGYDGEYYYEGE